MKIKLITSVIPPPALRKLNENDICLGIGSCFAANMLEKLFNAGFKGMINPNGIVYNAVSIAKSLDRIVREELYTENDFFFFNNLWHSWEHHGTFSNKNLNTALSSANSSLQKFRRYMSKCKCFIITPSSSVVYEYKKENIITANCHKVPNKEFNRKILSCNENINALRSIINSVRQINKNTEILFTLSPVRHYPGDPQLNSVSKASLRYAIHHILDADNNIFYFPSYEILMDELRDYRYYKDDLMHPSETAVNIIFQKFMESRIEKESIIKIETALKQKRSEKHITKNG
jgi:hypothetical protein